MLKYKQSLILSLCPTNKSLNNLDFLKFLEVLEGLERSGRPVFKLKKIERI